jgi:hypothetical protein
VETKGTRTVDPDTIREISKRIGQANSVQAAGDALFPLLTDMKEAIFSELAFVPADPLELAKLAGRARVVLELFKSLESTLADGKEAAKDLQRVKH